MATGESKRKKKKEAFAPPPEFNETEATDLMDHMAAIVKNTVFRYWFSPSDAVSAINECYIPLCKFLETYEQLSVRVVNGILIVNGHSIETRSPEMQTLIDHLTHLDIDNFTISNAIGAEEFALFFDILSSQPEELKKTGGFQAALEKQQIAHVETKKLIFRELAEEEMVIAKADYREGEGGGDGDDGVATGGILAFLKGEIGGKDEKVSEAVAEMASDPEKMAQLILQAAEIKQKADPTGGETLVDFVIGCLRRTFDGMTGDPQYKTQKGKKKMTRDLILLEEELVNRMRQMSLPEMTEQNLEAFTTATEDLTDEIKMDSVADEYMAKVDAIEESQSELLNIMREQGVGSPGGCLLENKLSERGLSSTGWQELVIKSGAGLGAGGGKGAGGGGQGEGGGGGGMFDVGHIVEAIHHLDTLLDTMEKEFAKGKEDPSGSQGEKMLDTLGDVSRAVRLLTLRTGIKIRDLVGHLRNDEVAVTAAEQQAKDAGMNIVLTRVQATRDIATILQEIIEPVDLVRSSLDMINSKVFDKDPEQKARVFRIMSDNTDIVKKLIDNLKSISGQTPTQPQ